MLNRILLSRSVHPVRQLTPSRRFLQFHCNIDDITLKWQNQVEKENEMIKAVPDLPFMEKEPEKIPLQPNISRKRTSNVR
jgi:hypothetical protein